MLLWSWLLAGVAMGLGAAPRPRPPLSAAATAQLLRRLTVCAQPAALAGVRLQATESWTLAGAARPQDTETDDVVFYHGVPLEVERTHDDRPLDAGAERRQQRTAAALERAIDAARAAGGRRLLNLHGEIWTMTRLEAQFHWRATAAGPGEIELAFTPRSGIRPRSRLQRLLTRTAGDFVVEAASGQIVRGEFHNLAPVDFGAGILARFTEFAGRFALQRAEAAWVLREVVVEVSGRELWRRVRGTETMGYRLAARAGRSGGGGR